MSSIYRFNLLNSQMGYTHFSANSTSTAHDMSHIYRKYIKVSNKKPPDDWGLFNNTLSSDAYFILFVSRSKILGTPNSFLN